MSLSAFRVIMSNRARRRGFRSRPACAVTCPSATPACRPPTRAAAAAATGGSAAAVVFPAEARRGGDDWRGRPAGAWLAGPVTAGCAAGAAASTVSRRRGRRHRRDAPGTRPGATGGTAVASGAGAASSPARAAAALAGRSAGSLASSRAVIWSRLAGRAGRRADGAPGSSRTCRQAMPTCDPAVNGGTPASISNSTQPSAYRSAAGPAGWPAACSGDR